jgi:hypothetical protein
LKLINIMAFIDLGLDVAGMAIGIIGYILYVLTFAVLAKRRSLGSSQPKALEVEFSPAISCQTSWRSTWILAGIPIILVPMLCYPGCLWGHTAPGCIPVPDEPLQDSGILLPSDLEAIAAEDVVNFAPEAPDPSELYTVRLTRQRVPVSSTGATTYHKSAYFGELTIGEPAVTFKVVFDTGSGHLILPSTYCRSETCKVHTRYRRSTSTTAKDIDYDGSIVAPGQPRDQITISFGTGEVTGVFVEDVVCLGENVAHGAKHSLESATDGKITSDDEPDVLPSGCLELRIIAATEMSEDPFKSFQFDGVLGLGLDGLSQAPQFNFLDVMAKRLNSKQGSAPQTFSVFLADNDGETSEISFGGWKQEHLQNNLAWNPVLEPEVGHWMLQIKELRVGGEKLKFCDDGQCRAVVDTGTSLLAVPTGVFPELYELLRHMAHRSEVCGVPGVGPELDLQLENFTVTLGPRDFSRAERRPIHYEQPWHHVTHAPPFDANARRAKDVLCKPLLMSMDLPAPLGPKLFILGEPVLRKFVSVYDAKEKRVGFARALHVGNEDDYFPDDPIKEDPVIPSAGDAIPMKTGSLLQTSANPGLDKCPSMIQLETDSAVKTLISPFVW